MPRFECESKDFVVHNMKVNGGMKTVPFILILALDGSKKSVSCTCHFTPRAEPAEPTADETGWALSWSGCFGSGKKYLIPVINPILNSLAVKSTAQSLYKLHLSISSWCESMMIIYLPSCHLLAYSFVHVAP
jgi:hypothetical protein